MSSASAVGWSSRKPRMAATTAGNPEGCFYSDRRPHRGGVSLKACSSDEPIASVVARDGQQEPRTMAINSKCWMVGADGIGTGTTDGQASRDHISAATWAKVGQKLGGSLNGGAAD